MSTAISAERAAAAALPPVDELRDRAAVRARERGRSRSTRGFLGRAFTVADHARHRSSATSSASRSGIARRTSWLVTRASRGRVRPPVGWARSPAAARSPGSASRSSLLIAVARLPRAGSSRRRSSACSARRSCASAADVARLPRHDAAARAGCSSARCSGTAERLVDLAVPVDPERDHIRGPEDAPVTLVEYGDFECPYCGQAEPVVRELLAGLRRRPLRLAAPAAQRRAPARAARRRGGRGRRRDRARSGRCTTCCSRTRTRCGPRDLVGYAEQLGLDVERFRDDLERHVGRRRGSPRTSTAPTSAASRARRRSSSTAAGTTAPTTSSTLTQAVKLARARASLTVGQPA